MPQITYTRNPISAGGWLCLVSHTDPEGKVWLTPCVKLPPKKQKTWCTSRILWGTCKKTIFDLWLSSLDRKPTALDCNKVEMIVFTPLKICLKTATCWSIYFFIYLTNIYWAPYLCARAGEKMEQSGNKISSLMSLSSFVQVAWGVD